MICLASRFSIRRVCKRMVVMKRRRLLILVLSVILIVGVAPIDHLQAQAGKTLHMALPEGDTNNLDPQQYETLGEFEVLVNVFEGLVGYDQKTLQPTPLLAEKWDVSSDGLKYTFHLRKGVKFQNGRALSADDVKY